MCVFGIVIALLLFIFLSAIEQLRLETEQSAHLQLLQATLREEREQHAHALTEAKQASLTLEQRVAALEKELKEAHKQLEKHEKCVDALARLKRALADSDSEDVKPVVKKEKK